MQIPFSDILQLHEDTLGLSDDDKKNLAAQRGIDYNDYCRRIGGKKKEAEFLIIMRCLRVIKTFNPVDEVATLATGEVPPEWQVEMPDGFKMYVEVKHTDDETFKITMSNLNKRISYASKRGLPLRFAISIKGFWAWYTSDYLLSNNGKIGINDSLKSYLDSELATCTYMFVRPFKVVSCFEKDTDYGIGIYDDKYGEMVYCKWYYDEKLLFTADKDNLHNISIIAILAGLHDELSKREQWITSSDSRTIITDTNTKIVLNKGNVIINRESQFLFIPEYNFFLATIMHRNAIAGVNENDNLFAAANDELFQHITVEYVRFAMMELKDMGVYIACSRGDKYYPIEEYKKLFWTKKIDEL